MQGNYAKVRKLNATILLNCKLCFFCLLFIAFRFGGGVGNLIRFLELAVCGQRGWHMFGTEPFVVFLPMIWSLSKITEIPTKIDIAKNHMNNEHRTNTNTHKHVSDGRAN